MSEEKAEKTVSIQIKGMRSGKGMQYACAGLHLAQEHRQYLPRVFKDDALGRSREQVKRKMVPGHVYTFPQSVAELYLEMSPEFLEVAKKSAKKETKK